MITRRNFIISTAALAGAHQAWACMPPPAFGGHHSVFMHDQACGDGRVANVFEPALLRVKSGDQVTFVASDLGHNSTSRRGMLPEGAAEWSGPTNESITVDFTVPGVYGYICIPHYAWGMVGVVVVDDDLSNLPALREIVHPPDAQDNFDRIFDALEAGLDAPAQG